MECSEALHHIMGDSDYDMSEGFTSDEEEGCAGNSASVLDVLDVVQVRLYYIITKSLVACIFLLKIVLVIKKAWYSLLFLCSFVKNTLVHPVYVFSTSSSLVRVSPTKTTASQLEKRPF